MNEPVISEDANTDEVAACEMGSSLVLYDPRNSDAWIKADNPLRW